MIMTRHCLFAFLLAGSWTVGATDTPPRKLAHDPFARPAFAMPAVPAGPTASVAAPGGDAAAELPFRLLMVINAGNHSVVNAGGKMLKLRERIEGYQLISVGDGSATFVKDGVRHVAEIGKETKK